jgi:hypothetical protein
MRARDSEAIHRATKRKQEWIASSQELLAMTAPVGATPPEIFNKVLHHLRNGLLVQRYVMGTVLAGLAMKMALETRRA